MQRRTRRSRWRWSPLGVTARAGWLRFFCAMIVPVLVIVYLVFKQWSVGDLGAYYANLRPDWPEFTRPLEFITDWGNIVFYPIYAFMLGWGLWRKRPELQRFAYVYLVVQLLISFALVRLLKIALGCPRPDAEAALFGLCLPGALDAGHNALPSGHVAEFTAALLPLVMCLRPLWPAILGGALVGLMAYSRVFLGWHSPPDVAFGLLFGSFGAWLIFSYGRKS